MYDMALLVYAIITHISTYTHHTHIWIDTHSLNADIETLISRVLQRKGWGGGGGA